MACNVTKKFFESFTSIIDSTLSLTSKMSKDNMNTDKYINALNLSNYFSLIPYNTDCNLLLAIRTSTNKKCPTIIHNKC